MVLPSSAFRFVNVGLILCSQLIVFFSHIEEPVFVEEQLVGGPVQEGLETDAGLLLRLRGRTHTDGQRALLSEDIFVFRLRTLAFNDKLLQQLRLLATVLLQFFSSRIPSHG